MAHSPQAETEHSTKDVVLAALVMVCFVVGCFFYGVGFNPIFLLATLFAPIVVLAGVSRARLLTLDVRLLIVCVLCLFGLAINHIVFSVSQDSSFMVSLIIATVPLWAIVVALLGPELRALRYACAVMFAFAIVSAFDFIAFGQRAHAPLWDPGNYTTLLYLAWFGTLGLTLGTTSSRRTTSLVGAVSLVFALALLATESRFSLLVVLGGVVFALLASLWLRVARAHAVAICSACALALALFLLPSLIGDAATGEGAAGVFAGAADSDSHRVLLYRAVSEAIQDHGGLGGTGLYSFSLLYPMYRSVEEQTTSAIFVHNDYVQLALEGGIWLILPLACLLGWVAISGWRHLVSARSWTPTAAFVAGLAIALTHALFNFVFYALPLAMFIGMLVGASFGNSVRPLSELGAGIVQVVNPVRWLFVGLLVFCGFLLSLDALTYGVFSNQLHMPGAKAIRSEPERMLSYARTAQALNPARGIPVLGEARLLEVGVGPESERTRESIEATYQRAIAVDPWNPLAYTSYASYLRQFPDSATERTVLLKQALALNPADTKTNAAVLEALIQQQRATEVIEHVGLIVEWCEWMRRDGGPDAEALLDRTTQVVEAAGLDSLQLRLEGCRSRWVSVATGDRTPPRLMRWLRENRD